MVVGRDGRTGSLAMTGVYRDRFGITLDEALGCVRPDRVAADRARNPGQSRHAEWHRQGLHYCLRLAEG
jgi:hypothetical protein